MTYLASFLEGIINFISPRLLPMLPIYLAYFAGSERLDSGVAKSEMAEILTRIAFYAGDPAWAAFKMAKEDAMGSERQDELEHGLVDAADGLAVVVSRRGPRGGSAAEPNPMRTPHFKRTIPAFDLQFDGHTARISYAAGPETGIKRRRRIVHGIDHERPSTGDRCDLGGVDDRIA